MESKRNKFNLKGIEIGLNNSYDNFIKEIEKIDNWRFKTIVGISYIEHFLEVIILSKIPKSEIILGEFTPFNKKIEILERLNIFKNCKILKVNLKEIAKIRNHYAHKIVSEEFPKEVIRLIDNLKPITQFEYKNKEKLIGKVSEEWRIEKNKYSNEIKLSKTINTTLHCLMFISEENEITKINPTL